MAAQKFKFSLQALLRVRHMQEQSLQLKVAEIERERLQTEEILRRQQHQLAEGKQVLRDNLVGRLRLDDLRMHATSSMSVMKAAHRLVLELAGTHRRLEAARAELILATQRRRAVELLRERRFSDWKRDIEHAETRMMDDLAVNAAARNASARGSHGGESDDKELP